MIIPSSDSDRCELDEYFASLRPTEDKTRWRYMVMLTCMDDGNPPASIHANLDEAKAAVRALLENPDIEPPMSEATRKRVEEEIASLDDGPDFQYVRGRDCWKERVYIAPFVEPKI